VSPQSERNILLAGVGCALALSSLIAGAMQATVRHDSQRTAVACLVARIKAWWVLAATLTAAFLAGNLAVVALFAFVSLACLREFITLTRPPPADRAALLTAFFLVLPAQYYLVWRGWHGWFSIFVPVYVFLVLPVLAALASDTRLFLARVAETQWGVMICVYFLSYIPALLSLHLPGRAAGSRADASAGLAVFLIVVVECSDIMQYVFGKLFGRHAIMPALSPSKTMEGLLGGVACATGLGAGLWWITPFTPGQCAPLALLIVLLGFFGGLVTSAIKRDRRTKDWGHLIPGHGGMIDRADSLCFSAPVFYYLVRYLLGSR